MIIAQPQQSLALCTMKRWNRDNWDTEDCGTMAALHNKNASKEATIFL